MAINNNSSTTFPVSDGPSGSSPMRMGAGKGEGRGTGGGMKVINPAPGGGKTMKTSGGGMSKNLGSR